MTTKRLSDRLDRLQLGTLRTPMAVARSEGESDEDFHRRALGAGPCVVIEAQPSETAEDWLARYAPGGSR